MHCAGVAVGTTGISDREELKLVVAFAMVLHKLPATFGLVSFLIACHWPLPRCVAFWVGSCTVLQGKHFSPTFVVKGIFRPGSFGGGSSLPTAGKWWQMVG